MKKKILFALCAAASIASAATVVLDDFEGDNNAAEGISATAWWYVYGTDGVTYTNTQDPSTESWDIFRAEGTNHYMSLEGVNLGSAQYPSAGLGNDFTAGSLSQCTGGFSYKYKGAAHKLRFTQNNFLKDKGYDFVVSQNAATSWTPVTVSIASIKQPAWIATSTEEGVAENAVAFDLSKVIGIAFVIDEKTAGSDLAIDDFACESSGGSSTVTGTATLIDDFEDGNVASETLGATAYWYLYDAGATYTNTQDANQTWDILDSVDGTNHWVTMKGISGITPGSDKNEIYTSVGMEVAFTSGKLAGCTAIQYDYKGSGHRMRSTVDGVTINKGWEHVAADQDASTDWKTVTVSTMAQPSWLSTVTGATVVAFSWAKVSRLTWVVDEKFTAANLGTSLSIDNVKCVGTLSTTTTPTSSASVAMAPVAPAGLKATLQGKTLQVSVAKAGLVKVQVFDMMGHAIESHSENITAGSFAHSFESLPMGSYVVRVQQGSAAKTLRMQVR
jgi:hypothetical protein